MAARSIASLTVSFGLVSIPVKLYSATEASRAISFNLLHRTCGSRLRQQYVCIKEDVVVPRENLVGELNNGWQLSMGSLAHERAMLWINYAYDLAEAIDRLVDLGKREGFDARARDRVAAAAIDAQALQALGYRGFAKFAKGNISPEHSVLKLFGSELAQRAARLATEVMGVDALDVAWDGTGYDESRGEAPWMKRYLQTFGSTISAGASEIQRNIIAQRVLGMPRR